MPEEGISTKKQHKDILSFEEITEVVKAAAKIGVNKIRITGGEPLVRKDLVKFVSAISKIEGINDIALTTNGLLLKEMGKELKAAGLNRLNISIDTLRPERYKEITRGGDLNRVLDGIQEALRLKLKPIKLNTVVIGGFNEDEIADLVELTVKDDIDVRFIELMPVGEAGSWAKERFISNEEIRARIGTLQHLEGEPGSAAKYYRIPNGKGRVGFIDPVSDHFCGSCNRIRMTSDGKLKPCLHSNQEVDIMETIRKEPHAIQDALRRAIMLKPEKHELYTSHQEVSHRNMSEIGG
jgi:cyclic pyranopterin phosphate synthase